MKQNKLFIGLIIGILMLNGVLAWSTNMFNNSLTSENMSMIAEQWQTRWLNIPTNTYLINGYINLSGYSLYYTNGFCGQKYTGNYVFDGYAIGYSNIVDGNWDTSHYITSGAVFTINYSKPVGATSAIWQVKFNDQGQNINNTNVTIPISCFSESVISLRIYHQTGMSPNNPFIFYCHNSSGYGTIFYKELVGQAYLYEEAMIWNNGTNNCYQEQTNSSGYPRGVEVGIGDSTGYFIPSGADEDKELNSTNSPNKSINLANWINSYTPLCNCIDCNLITGFCQVPFNFRSYYSNGILGYNGLIFNNEAQYTFTNEDTGVVIIPRCSVDYGYISTTNLYTSGNNSIVNLTCELEEQGMQQTSWSFNVTDGDKSFIIGSNKLVLRFVNGIGNYITTNWTITDEQKTMYLNGTNYTISQSNLSEGKVLIDFNLRYEINDSNYSQSYEYINDFSIYINETLYVLPNINKQVSVKVSDKDNKLIENARVRTSCRIPAYLIWSNMTLTNQKLTDGIGNTNLGFYTPNSGVVYSCKIEVIAEGYVSQNIIDNPNNWNREIPFKLAKATTTSYNNLWLNILPKTFNESTSYIYGAYYYLYGQNLTVTTSYRTLNGLGRRRLSSLDSTDTYGFRLDKNVDWDGTSTNDIIIESWRFQSGSWVNIRNDTITYSSPTDILNIKDYATSQWAITLFLIFLILFSGVISYLTNSPTAGVTVFMGGLTVNTLVLSGWKAGILTFVGILYFVLIIIRRLNKE